MRSDLTFRPAGPGDLTGIVALLADDVLGATREAPGPSLHPDYARAFAAMRRQPGNQAIVAERADEILGCLQLVVIAGLSHRGMSRAEIEMVRVRADMRGQGIGEALVRHAVGLAAAEGCGLVQLTSNRMRADAIRFYERLGFQATHIGMKLPLG